MGMNNICRRFAAWIACFAILFAALAPSVSHAMSAARGEPWVAHCAMAGNMAMSMGADHDGAAAPKTKQSPQLQHCPYCATHAASFGLPPGTDNAIPLLETQEARPFLFFQSPRPLPAWTAAQSRAPPAQR